MMRELTNTDVLDFLEMFPEKQFSYKETKPESTDAPREGYWRKVFSWKDKRNQFPSLKEAVKAYIIHPETF